MTDDDLVPVSVRLGNVVPPEDPEDWTRPLTWVAALGMLAGPFAAFAWFLAAPPVESAQALPATFAVAAALAAGAAATGATQLGIARAWTATLGAGLFGALVVIILGVVMAGERQVSSASPTLAHAFTAALGGLAGTGAASAVNAVVHRRPRPLRAALSSVVGVAVAVGGVGLLLPPVDASADLPEATAAECRTELADRSVTIRYPAEWWAGSSEGPGEPCAWFASAAVEDAGSVQIIIGAAGGGPEPVRDVVSEEGILIDGHPARRVEHEFHRPDGAVVRRVAYDISLGATLQSGPVIIMSTDSGRPGGFTGNVRVLDRMAQLIRIAPER